MVERPPEVLHRIGAPGAPSLAPCEQCPPADRQAERSGAAHHAEVAPGERVGIAQGPHRDELERPRSDAADAAEVLSGARSVRAGPELELERAVGERRHEREEGPTA
jgi:hypothetical protein